MMSIATTKRSPIVLIRTLTAIEAIVVILYLLGTTIDSFKYELYTLLPFSGIYSYESLKLLLLPLAQLAITIYAFLSWHRESYIIRQTQIIHSWGVISKKKRIVPFDSTTTITTKSGPLGKLLRYGSIYLENTSSKTLLVIKDIPRAQEFLKILRKAMKGELISLNHEIVRNNKVFDEKLNILDLLTKEESEQLEFKSSLRFDHKIGHANRDLEKAAMKTIAAFLNTKGGHLVIGVDDTKKPIGLTSDYPLLQRPNNDGFENHFTQVFNTMIGPELRHLVRVSFHNIQNVDVCVVKALESSKPVYLKSNGDEHFYIRTGNTTTLLKLSEIEEYRQSRFPRSSSMA